MTPKFLEIPHDKAAEGAVIGSMIVDSTCIQNVVEFLSSDDFFTPEAQYLFRLICDLWKEKQPIDAVVIRSRFPESCTGYFDYMVGAMESVPSSANALYYARLVYRKSVERKLIHLVEDMGKTVSDINCSVEDKLAAFSNGMMGSLPSLEINKKDNKLSVIMKKCLLDLEDEGGLTTGFSRLDRMLGGFKKDNFILIAGRPSMGKSSLMLDFYIHCARIGARPYLYSLEMVRERVAWRIIRNVARYRHRIINKSSPEIIETVDLITKWPAWIERKCDMEIGEITNQILVEKSKNNIGICFVDYLQLIEGVGKSKYEQTSYISRELKKTAIKADIPVVVLSQLNRACELRNNHRPCMSDLRDSGAIEQDADAIIFLHRDDYYRQKENPQAQLDGLAQAILAKNREGVTGDIDLIWLPECTSFAQKTEDGFFV